MYRYKDLKELHLELSSNCQASCPMCARNHHGGLSNPKLKVNDINLNFFKKIVPSDLLIQLNQISMCGNFGDPILNQDLISIVEYIKIISAETKIDIHTNGGARSTKWWKDLALALPTNHLVHFALDGLADTHSLYRIGTDWNKIIDNAKSFIEAGGNARWVFITFKHNEHQLDECKKLAESLGFNSFFEKQTSRFIGTPYYEVYNKEGKVSHKLEMPTVHKLAFIDKKTVENYRKIFSEVKINCDVEKTKSIYIDANGYLWPCCFVGAVPYIYTKSDQLVHSFQEDSRQTFFEFIDKFGGLENFNLQNKTIEEIVDSDQWQTLWIDSFENNPLRACSRTCGVFKNHQISKSKDQFLKLDQFNE